MSKVSASAIAGALKKLREGKGLTAAQLAKKAKFGQAIINRVESAVEAGYEQGLGLNIDTLLKWLDALEVSAGDFFAMLESPEASERVPGYDDLYENLSTILRSSNRRRILGIRVNLEDISAAAKNEREVGALDKRSHSPPQPKPGKPRRASSP